MIQEWIKNNPKASICTEEGVSEFKNIANFQDYHGLPEFREVINKSAAYLFIYLRKRKTVRIITAHYPAFIDKIILKEEVKRIYSSV